MYDNLSPALYKAYLDTSYIVYTPQTEYTLKIGTMNQEWQEFLQGKSCHFYFFITAWNPYSIIQLDTDNEKSNLKLIYTIKELQIEFFEGIGISSDQNWMEKSICVLGGDLSLAYKLGNEFRQNAFVCGSFNQPPSLFITKK